MKGAECGFIVCDYPKELLRTEKREDQHIRLVEDYGILLDGIYRLATAIYTIATYEANGQFSHWTGVPVSDETFDRLRNNAEYFVSDWRSHFSKRVRGEYVP